MKHLLIILSVFSIALSFGQSRNTLLLNGFLHVGNGEVIPSAAIGMSEGKITLIKNSLAYTVQKDDWDTIIDLRGKHIYPGFVASNSTLGITEIDAVRATRDFDEVGQFNPHVKSQVAYNVESKVISTVRTNGVLITQPTPRGGIISGTSSVMFMDGWNWEDATINAADGIHLNWPSSMERSKTNRSVYEAKKDYQERKETIYTFFTNAKAYGNKRNQDPLDLRFEAMKECLTGKGRVYIHADELQQLHDVIDFVNAFDLPFPVIVGGYDSHLITRKLKDAKIPVMLYRSHSLPQREGDPIDLPYKTAALLKEGGVLFCLQNEGDMEAMNARNIPFLAGTAMAYGLTEEEAIRSITLDACKIMGIDDLYGSIEVGKSATLFVSDGSALDMVSNQLHLAFVNGVLMSNTNSQIQLFKKYSHKYNK